MPDQPTPVHSSGPLEVATYVASLATELATLARKTRLGTLEYLLEMVRLEAENVRRQTAKDKGECARGERAVPRKSL